MSNINVKQDFKVNVNTDSGLISFKEFVTANNLLRTLLFINGDSTNNTQFKLDDIDYEFNDLIVKFDNFPNQLNIFIEDGEFILIGEENEINKYSINTNGELIYTHMTIIKNLGQISAVHKGVSSPSNTNLIWIDTSNPSQYVFKIYDASTSSWITFPSVVRRYTQQGDDVSTVFSFNHNLNISTLNYMVQIDMFDGTSSTTIFDGSSSSAYGTITIEKNATTVNVAFDSAIPSSLQIRCLVLN